MSSTTSIHSSDPLLWAPWEMEILFTMQGWNYARSWRLFSAWKEPNVVDSNAVEMTVPPVSTNQAQSDHSRDTSETPYSDDPSAVEAGSATVDIGNNKQVVLNVGERNPSRSLRNIYVKKNPLRALNRLPFLTRRSWNINHWALVVATENDVLQRKPVIAWDLIQKKRHIHLRIGVIQEELDNGADPFHNMVKIGETEFTDMEISQEAIASIKQMSGVDNFLELRYSVFIKNCQLFAQIMAQKICCNDDSEIQRIRRRLDLHVVACVLAAAVFLASLYATGAVLIMRQHFRTPVEDGLLAVVGLFAGGLTFTFFYTIFGFGL